MTWGVTPGLRERTGRSAFWVWILRLLCRYRLGAERSLPEEELRPFPECWGSPSWLNISLSVTARGLASPVYLCRHEGCAGLPHTGMAIYSVYSITLSLLFVMGVSGPEKLMLVTVSLSDRKCAGSPPMDRTFLAFHGSTALSCFGSLGAFFDLIFLSWKVGFFPLVQQS